MKATCVLPRRRSALFTLTQEGQVGHKVSFEKGFYGQQCTRRIKRQVAGLGCRLISIQKVVGAMSWTIPRYNRKDVNEAGDCLIADDQVIWIQDRDRILTTINNWRSSHSFPLQSFKMTLLTRAKRADRKAIVAQRLKRLSSIDAKLRRFKNMKLSQMQDIGGCRAVVENILRLERLAARGGTTFSWVTKFVPEIAVISTTVEP